MSAQAKGVQVSIVLHAAVILSLTGIGSSMVQPPSRIVVDFTLLEPQRGLETATVRPIDPDPPAPRGTPKRNPVRPAAPDPSPTQAVSSLSERQVPVTARTVPVAPPAPALSESHGPVQASAAETARAAPSAAGGAPAGALPTPSRPEGLAGARVARETTNGSLPGSAASAESLFRQQHFSYIRDSIQKVISYPAVARKMKWQGKVIVSFTILADGNVKDVRVLESSGHSVLDRNAMEAVKGTAPYPRPPGETEIITPVIYTLK